MPRKAFVADLQEAIELIEISGVSGLRPGGEDGTFTFSHKVSSTSPDVTVQAMVLGTTTLWFGCPARQSQGVG